MAAEKAYWTAKELSEYAAIPLRTVYKWVENNSIPATKLNGVIRFPIERCKKYLEDRTSQPKRVIA